MPGEELLNLTAEYSPRLIEDDHGSWHILPSVFRVIYYVKFTCHDGFDKDVPFHGCDLTRFPLSPMRTS